MYFQFHRVTHMLPLISCGLAMVNCKCTGGHHDRSNDDVAGMLSKLFHPAEREIVVFGS